MDSQQLDEDFNFLHDKPEDFSPVLYSLHIINHFLIHEINNKIKLTQSYSSINRLLKEIAEQLKNGSPIETIPSAEKLDSSCFIYFITVKKTFKTNHTKKIQDFLHNENSEKEGYSESNIKGNNITFEKLVYIGKSTNLAKRFKKGHKVTQLLNNPKYDNAEKRIYLAQVRLLMKEDHGVFLPLEGISPRKLMGNILSLIESVLIPCFNIPEYNEKDKIPKIYFNKDKKPEWVNTLMADFINIHDQEGQSMLFQKDITIPLADFLMLAVDKIPFKYLEHSVLTNDEIGKLVKKVFN